MLPNISQIKGNETMKYGQVINITKFFIFLQNFIENGAEKVFPDLFLFFKKAIYELSVSGLHLSFVIFQ